MSRGEFSVVQFFQDDSYEKVRERVDVQEAWKAFEHYTNNVACKIGITKRVIITDGGDCTNVEWINGQGIVYPTKEELKKLKK
ncbi:hypothetical protein EHM76_04405 [bacterium]|nr:MAG: hypothetical protein EHM76_04405 [bacterium]